MSHKIPQELQTIRMELLSDTTFGRGEGTAGQVDVEVDHDELGIPFVNGKTIRSLLRDTWLTMQPQFPDLQSAARRVFGPHAELDETGILRIGRASIGAEDREWIKAAVERKTQPVPADAILSGFTDIRSQTSEDRETGAPQRATLRSMRVVIRGLDLSAELRWLDTPTADDVRCLALALLGTRHAGLSRNRGRGHVRFGFGGSDTARLTAEYALGESSFSAFKSAASEIHHAVPEVPKPEANPSKLQVWYVPYRLALNSPAVVTGLTHDPNTVATLCYIPGSMLRGALARAIGNPDRDEAARAEFQSLVLGGNVAWLNAYPNHDNSRTLPAPPGLRRDKQQPGAANDPWDVFDLAVYDGRPGPTHELETDDGELHWPEESLAGLGESFVTLGSSGYRLSPDVSGRVHQQRDRERGCSWTDTSQRDEKPRGTLFAVESLDAGQTFQGAIQIRAGSDSERDAILKRIESLLGGNVLLGRSRRAEYGGDARITFCFDPNRRREWPRICWRGVINAGQLFRVQLVSPCLIRNQDTGQFDPAALADVIVEKLKGRAAVKCVRAGFETVGGFNRKWRLELPQVLAVATGSTVVLQATDTISLSEIESLENAGLGERRTEGFGRIVFLEHSEHGQSKLRKPDPDRTTPVLSSAPPKLIQQLQQRLALAALERAVQDVASDIANPAIRPPSNSLIGRLRELLRDQSDAGCEQAVANLRVWLKDSDEKKRLKKPAMDKLDRCRVGSTSQANRDRNPSLTRWLGEVIESDPVPRDLNLAAVADHCRLVVNNESNDAADLVAGLLHERPNWLKVRLIDAVLDLLALRNRQRKGEE